MKIFTFDTETTAATPKDARVVQAALMEYDFDAETEKVIFNHYCDPGIPIPEGAGAVHGITDAMVQGRQTDTSLMLDVYKVIADEAAKPGAQVVLAGHNLVTYDIPILERISGREPIISHGVLVVDTLTLATRLLPDAPNHKLSTLTEWLKLGTSDGAHDALVDIKMVYELLVYFSAKTGKTMVELAEWCKQPVVLKVAHFGKHKGKLWGFGPGDTHVPKWYASFIRANFDTMSPDMDATLKASYNI